MDILSYNCTLHNRERENSLKSNLLHLVPFIQKKSLTLF